MSDYFEDTLGDEPDAAVVRWMDRPPLHVGAAALSSAVAGAFLLGAVAARELFGQADPLGQWLRFDNRRFRVVGVFTSQSSNLGMDMAEAALIPVGRAMRLFNTAGLIRL